MRSWVQLLEGERERDAKKKKKKKKKFAPNELFSDITPIFAFVEYLFWPIYLANNIVFEQVFAYTPQALGQ